MFYTSMNMHLLKWFIIDHNDYLILSSICNNKQSQAQFPVMDYLSNIDCNINTSSLVVIWIPSSVVFKHSLTCATFYFELFILLANSMVGFSSYFVKMLFFSVGFKINILVWQRYCTKGLSYRDYSRDIASHFVASHYILNISFNYHQFI